MQPAPEPSPILQIAEDPHCWLLFLRGVPSAEHNKPLF